MEENKRREDQWHRAVSLLKSPSGESTVAMVSARESGSKPRRRTRWEPISPELESSLVVEPFVNLFAVRMEEGKRLIKKR